MSITTMTKQQDATTTSSSSSSETKQEVAHWLNQKDERTFKLKQALTFLHFLSLLTTAITYMAPSLFERFQGRAIILAFGTFVLSFCIPPIGMISPEDAPDATRKALGWMPERGDLRELRREMMSEEEEKKGKSKKVGGNNKKKKGKKTD